MEKRLNLIDGWKHASDWHNGDCRPYHCQLQSWHSFQNVHFFFLLVSSHLTLQINIINGKDVARKILHSVLKKKDNWLFLTGFNCRRCGPALQSPSVFDSDPKESSKDSEIVSNSSTGVFEGWFLYHPDTFLCIWELSPRIWRSILIYTAPA